MPAPCSQRGFSSELLTKDMMEDQQPLSHKAADNEPLHLFAPAGSLLLVSVLASLGTAAGSVIVLDPSDHISLTRGLWIWLLGICFFVSLFDLLNHVGLRTHTGHRCMKKYDLRMHEVLDISNKCVSAVQSALCCIAGGVICSWSCQRDFMCTSHYMSEAYAWFGTAYFFYDLWSMYYVWTHDTSRILPTRVTDRVKAFVSCQPLIVGHHLFIGTVGFLIIVWLRGELGDCVFGFVYLMEMSTPFVSARVVLSRLKMKHSAMYMYNGLLMLGTFLLCRILIFPYAGYLYLQSTKIGIWQGLWGLPWGAKMVVGILFVPQLYWFSLMLVGALKLLLETSKDT